jgi:hypothetical protein
METQKVEAQANAKFHDAMDEADSINAKSKKKEKSEDDKSAAAGES